MRFLLNHSVRTVSHRGHVLKSTKSFLSNTSVSNRVNLVRLSRDLRAAHQSVSQRHTMGDGRTQAAQREQRPLHAQTRQYNTEIMNALQTVLRKVELLRDGTPSLRHSKGDLCQVLVAEIQCLAASTHKHKPTGHPRSHTARGKARQRRTMAPRPFAEPRN
jgi:hypothetical protein